MGDSLNLCWNIGQVMCTNVPLSANYPCTFLTAILSEEKYKDLRLRNLQFNGILIMYAEEKCMHLYCKP